MSWWRRLFGSRYSTSSAAESPVRDTDEVSAEVSSDVSGGTRTPERHAPSGREVDHERLGDGADPSQNDQGEIEREAEAVALPISDTLDLHPFQPREIAEVTRAFLDAAVEESLSEVRIIHGRGTGTQRRIVRGILEQDARVASFADAAGNWGATVVQLRP